VTGSGFGKVAPTANPTTRPCSEDDVTGNGFDHGNKVVFWDLNDQALWQAGFPGDCIGINFVSYAPTKIVFILGDWYRLPDSLSAVSSKRATSSRSASRVPLAPESCPASADRFGLWSCECGGPIRGPPPFVSVLCDRPKQRLRANRYLAPI
jgi:hypothetical protein